MRILILSKAFPRDPRTKVHGVYHRLGLFVDALKEIAHLHFLFFTPPDVDASEASRRRYRASLSEHWKADLELTLVTREPEPSSRWETYGRGLLDCFRQPRFGYAGGARQQGAVDDLLATEPDAVFVHRLAAMAPVLRTNRPLPPVYFDLDDVEHIALLRNVSQPPVWWAKRLHYLKLPALWWGERRALALAHRTFVCSETDRRSLERGMKVSGVRVVPNAIEIPDLRSSPPGPTVLFLGALNYGPNQNAARELLREIWPRVRREVPDAKLVIAGPHPHLLEGRGVDQPGVELPGFVEDLGDLYARTRVVCVPIRSGGGTRIKILEAAAFAKPIVSTPIGVEGIRLEDGRHLLVRRSPEALAEAVVQLLRDPGRCRDLGRAARDAVREIYARDPVLKRIRDEFVTGAPAG